MTEQERYPYIVSAAGRVNLIGEHVDYCGGKVLPCALSLKNTIYARPNHTDRIVIRWTDLSETAELDLAKLDTYRNLKYANYPAGCAYFWRQAGHRVIGCDLLMDCTVPFGSGLSSSAAIEVSTIAALATVAEEPFDPVEVALVACKAEREYAGVNCGIMDQYVSANGRAGQAILLDCNTLEREYIPVELGDYALVVADCKKPHNLVESRYNERRAETEKALELLRQRYSLSCLARIGLDELEAARNLLPTVVYRRARHVAEECARVKEAAAAMRVGNMKRLGQLLNDSHESLRFLYEVTGKELDALVHAAQTFDGCLGSRMTGAGFGGCTVSLVRRDRTEEFKASVAEAYERETGYVPAFYPAELSDGIVVTKR